MRISKVSSVVDSCIGTFLKHYRKFSHVDDRYGGAYFWNEREVQWALFRHLRERMTPHGIGSEWWVHAEGSVERPKYARWGARRRADIVIINHNAFRKWWRQESKKEPAYEAMIELKLFWRGQGQKSTIYSIKDAVKKLEACLSARLTKNAYLVLLDGVDRNDYAYYRLDDLSSMRHNDKLVVYHWPHSRGKITDLKAADWEKC